MNEEHDISACVCVCVCVCTDMCFSSKAILYFNSQVGILIAWSWSGSYNDRSWNFAEAVVSFTQFRHDWLLRH
jgi:hypothetical protein